MIAARCGNHGLETLIRIHTLWGGVGSEICLRPFFLFCFEMLFLNNLKIGKERCVGWVGWGGVGSKEIDSLILHVLEELKDQQKQNGLWGRGQNGRL